jgi:hypothetical protein
LLYPLNLPRKEEGALGTLPCHLEFVLLSLSGLAEWVASRGKPNLHRESEKSFGLSSKRSEVCQRGTGRAWPPSGGQGDEVLSCTLVPCWGAQRVAGTGGWQREKDQSWDWVLQGGREHGSAQGLR